MYLCYGHTESDKIQMHPIRSCERVRSQVCAHGLKDFFHKT